MEPNPLRYAVIGMGNISPYHLRDIAVQPGITVVGFADAADPKAWKVDAAHAAVPRFQDVEKMLRETKPDLVSICTPNKFHRDYTLLALKHGVYPEGLLKGILACFTYCDPDKKQQLSDLIGEKGLPAVLQEVCGLSMQDELAVLIHEQLLKTSLHGGA